MVYHGVNESWAEGLFLTPHLSATTLEEETHLCSVQPGIASNRFVEFCFGVVLLCFEGFPIFKVSIKLCSHTKCFTRSTFENQVLP